MQPIRTRHLFLVPLLAAALAGCTLGPEPQRPPTTADDAASFVHAQGDWADVDPAHDADSDSASDIDPWWRSFGDQATVELVELALENNTDLRAAAARVLEARAGLGSARSSLWPEVGAGLDASRVKNSFTLPEIGRVGVYSTTYGVSLDASYQVDLFGRLKRTRQAAWADLLAEKAARRTVVHTVVAEVVRTRARIATLERGLALASSIRDSWSDTLESIDRRYQSGLVEALDLRLARENLASAEAAVVDAEQTLAQAKLALDVLTGVRPGTGSVLDGDEGSGLAELPDLAPIPVGLPADLLDRRPDLAQAEMRLAAATSRVGVALGNLYPRLTLTGSAGTSSDTLGDVLSSDALVYNAILGLVAPLVDGGRRRAEVEASRARAEQAAAAYAGAVLSALRDVEDALVRGDAVARRLGHLSTRVEEARAADRIARARYRRGVATFQQVLDTERRLRAAEQALVAARGDAWNARIDLYLALGGDWVDETDLDARPTANAIASTDLDSQTTDDPAKHATPEAAPSRGLER